MIGSFIFALFRKFRIRTGWYVVESDFDCKEHSDAIVRVRVRG